MKGKDNRKARPDGSGSIFKRGSGSNEGDWIGYVHVPDGNGKTKRRTFTGKSKIEVMRRILSFKIENHPGGGDGG